MMVHRVEANKDKIISRLITGMILGLVVFVAFFMWGDLSKVFDILVRLPWYIYVLAFSSTFVSYLVRFAKWHISMKRLMIPVRPKDSLMIFFVGLSMSMTPGKIGELLKTFYLKKVAKTEVAKSLSAVFIDRFTDLTAMALLISLGLLVFPINHIVIAVLVFAILVVIFLLKYERSSEWIVKVVMVLPVLKRLEEPVALLLRSIRNLLNWPTFMTMVALSTLSWTLECVSLYLFTTALDLHLSFLQDVFIFSLGTVAGALSMVPGGLGVAEGSMAGLLLYFGILKADAVSVTLLIRIVTLWFGVMIGLIVFFKTKKKYL